MHLLHSWMLCILQYTVHCTLDKVDVVYFSIEYTIHSRQDRSGIYCNIVNNVLSVHYKRSMTMLYILQYSVHYM